MNSYLIILIIFTFIAVIALIFFSGYTKLKKYKEKMDKAENLIDTNLEKKLELIITLNSSIKKVTGKKDYLKEYIAIKDMIITNIEKDLKLDEAVKLINDLIIDFNELNSNNDFLNIYKTLKSTDEILISAKNVFNQNAILSNQLIKNFPNNLVAKITKFKIRSFYNLNNKTDDGEAF